MHSSLVRVRKTLKTAVVGVGLALAIVSVFSAFMIILHIVYSFFGINNVGIWFYGAPSFANWGFNFFNLGGLELHGPNGLGFFTCQGQC